MNGTLSTVIDVVLIPAAATAAVVGLSSLMHHHDTVTVLQTREIASVMATACRALEGAMNIEATALGVAGLLEDESI